MRFFGVRAEEALTSAITMDDATSGKNEVFKFNLTKGSNSNSPAWNSGDQAVRVYGNNELSIELLSNDSSHITGVTFTGKYKTNITWQDWTCDQADVTSSNDYKTWTVGSESNYGSLSFL